jgi:sulfur-oxidizing protein SoxZ
MTARIQVKPAQPRAGEVMEVRIIIAHIMESGQRRDDVGNRIQRNIINRLTCRYDGREVFNARIGSGIAANPYFMFLVRATRSGELVFDWVDDDGETGSETFAITVTG